MTGESAAFINFCTTANTALTTMQCWNAGCQSPQAFKARPSTASKHLLLLYTVSVADVLPHTEEQNQFRARL